MKTITFFLLLLFSAKFLFSQDIIHRNIWSEKYYELSLNCKIHPLDIPTEYCEIDTTSKIIEYYQIALSRSNSVDSICKLIQFEIIFMHRRENIIDGLSKLLIENIDLEINKIFLLHNLNLYRELKVDSSTEWQIKYTIYENLKKENLAQKKLIDYFLSSTYLEKLHETGKFDGLNLLQLIILQNQRMNEVKNFYDSKKNLGTTDFIHEYLKLLTGPTIGILKELD